jgi:hypothetical protein
MLKAGDFDLMRSLFRMYCRALPLAQFRTRASFGHEGAFFPETLVFWGAYTLGDYGWNREGKHVSDVANGYIRRYWQGGLELTAMMLDYYAYTQDKDFARDTLVPLAAAIVEFYDQHFPRDDRGKILFKPSQALETWHEAVNPLPEIAGLHFVLDGLLSLPPGLASREQRRAWNRLRGELPPLPAKQENGKTILLAAEELLGPVRNQENPELYAIFPYRLYGVGGPDLQVGRLTFQQRKNRTTSCWQQDAIQAAYLGLADVARAYTVQNFSKHHRGSRFPAFWGPNNDWIPDLDHGGVAMTALQAMLLQATNEKVLLFPAWPKEWDVEFRLRAPLNTTVEGVFRRGRLEQFKVTPEARVKYVVKIEPQ